MSAPLRAITPLQQAAHDFSTQFADHHAVAPAGPGEVIVVAVGVLITAVVAFYTLKYFFRPGEGGSGHIKRRILGGEGENE